MGNQTNLKTLNFKVLAGALCIQQMNDYDSLKECMSLIFSKRKTITRLHETLQITNFYFQTIIFVHVLNTKRSGPNCNVQCFPMRLNSHCIMHLVQWNVSINQKSFIYMKNKINQMKLLKKNIIRTMKKKTITTEKQQFNIFLILMRNGLFCVSPKKNQQP